MSYSTPNNTDDLKVTIRACLAHPSLSHWSFLLFLCCPFMGLGVRPRNITTLLIWILPTSSWFIPMIPHQLSSHHYRQPRPLLGLGFLGPPLQLHKGDLNKEQFKGIKYWLSNEQYIHSKLFTCDRQVCILIFSHSPVPVIWYVVLSFVGQRNMLFLRILYQNT